MRGVYAVDDVSTTYVDAKIHFFEEWAMTHPADEAMVVRVLGRGSRARGFARRR